MRKGRPRYDDILTPREWEVLDLIREGLTNEQIAERLEMSFATARFHVSEIITKLGVESRLQAAAWSGRPRSLRAFTLLPRLRRVEVERVRSFLRELPAFVVVVALLSLLLLALGVVYNSRQSMEARQPATTPAVEAVDETEVIVLSPLTTPADRVQRESCSTSIVLVREGVWRVRAGHRLHNLHPSV